MYACLRLSRFVSIIVRGHFVCHMVSFCVVLYLYTVISYVECCEFGCRYEYRLPVMTRLRNDALCRGVHSVVIMKQNLHGQNRRERNSSIFLTKWGILGRP